MKEARKTYKNNKKLNEVHIEGEEYLLRVNLSKKTIFDPVTETEMDLVNKKMGFSPE